VDETLAAGVVAEAGAVELAERKARAVAGRFHGEERWVLGADTIVAVEVDGKDRILGKPTGEAAAAGMLEALSGSRHRVVTGVCALRTRDDAVASGYERTFVTMRPLTVAEIEGYVASGEWRDKAGGYAIQETADRFVTSLEEGGFDNVVGLPVELTLRLLGELSAPL
jgi:septum formation protein